MPGALEAFLDASGKQTAAAANANVTAPTPYTADEVAEHKTLAQQTGLPEPVVAMDPDGAKLDKEKADNDSWFSFPALAEAYAKSFGDAQVGKDDVGTMHELFQNLEKLKDNPLSGAIFQTPFGKGLVQGADADVYANNAAEWWATRNPDKLQALESFEAQPKPETYEGAADGIANRVGQLMGQFGHQAGGVALGAAGGAFAGAPGGIPGMLIGAGAGATAVVATQGAAQNAGLIYRQLQLDENGNKISESTKNAAAVIGGLSTGILLGIGGKAATGPVNSAVVKWVTSAAGNYALSRAAGELGAAALEGAALNAAMTMAQKIAIATAKTEAGVVMGNADWTALAHETLTSAFEGALVMGTLRLPAVGKSAVTDFLREKQAAAMKQFLSDAMAAAERSKTRARSPDTAESMIATTADPESQTVGVPATAVPEGKVPGGATEADVQLARETGGDVTVPTASYLTRTSKEEFKAQEDDVKVNGGISVREGEELAKHHEEQAAVAEAHAVAADDAQQAAAGPPQMALTRVETPKGTTGDNFTFTDPSGRFKPTDISVIPNQEKKSIRIDWMGNEAGEGAFGQHGTSVLKQAMKALKAEYPWAEKIEGERIGGAREKAGGTDLEAAASLPDFTPKSTPEQQAMVSRTTVEPTSATHDFIPADRALPEGARHSYTPAVKVGSQVTGGATHEEALARHIQATSVIPQPKVSKDGEEVSPVVPGFFVPKEPTVMQGPKAVAALAGAKAREDMWLTPIFKNAQTMRMSATDFTNYAKRLLELQAAQDLAIFNRVEKEQKRRESLKGKQDEQAIAGFVQNMIYTRPDVQADVYLRTGKDYTGAKQPIVRLDRDAVNALFSPEEAARDLGATRAADALDAQHTTRKDGLSPDQMASLFGYDTGKELVIGLAGLANNRKLNGLSPQQQIDGLIREETARSLELTHGDPEENAFNSALDAVLSEPQIDFLTQESTVLAMAAGQRALTKRDILARAHELVWGSREGADVYTAPMVAVDTLKKQGVGVYQKLVGDMGRKAESALLKGNYVEAFQYKQTQALDAAVLKEVAAIAKAQKQFKKLADRYGGNKPPKGDANIIAHIQAQMVRFGLPVARNPAELRNHLAGMKPLADFVRDMELAGLEIPIPDWVLQPMSLTPGMNFDKFSVPEFSDFHEFVQAMDKISRGTAKILAGQERLNFQETVETAVTVLQTLKTVNNDWRTNPYQAVRAGGRVLKGQLLIMEQMFDWADRRNTNGVFNRVVVQPLKRAESYENDLLRRYGRMAKDLSKKQGLAWKRSLKDAIPNKTLVDWYTGEIRPLNRDQLIQYALNYGNTSSRKKLTAAFEHHPIGAAADAAPAIYQNRPEDVEAMLDQHLRKEDLDYIQGIFDIHADLLPAINAMSRRLTGVGIDQLEPTPIVTQAGTIKGGYYPLKADARWNGVANEDPKDGLLAPGIYGRATPNRRYTNVRTGAAYPLELSGTVGTKQTPNWVYNLQQMIHDVAFREAIINADKLLSNKRIKDQLDARFGPQVASQVRPWLYDIANPHQLAQQTNAHMAALNWISGQVRSRLVAVQMMYRMSTTVKHSLTMVSHTFGELGVDTKRFPAEFARQYGNPMMMKERWMEIQQLSPYMRNRYITWDRDLGALSKQALGSNTWGRVFARNGGWMIQKIDQLFSNVQWKVVYDHMLEQGMTQDQAVFAADKSIRAAHGDGGLTTLPAVMRGPEWAKTLTVAYTFFNDTANRSMEHAQLAKEGAWDMQAGKSGDAFTKWFQAFWGVLTFAVVPGLFETIGSNQPPPKHDDLVHKLAHGTMDIYAGTVPLLRDIIRWGQGKPSDGPVLSTAISLTKMQKVLSAALFHTRQKSRQPLRDVAEGVGTIAKIPGAAQLGITTQALHDIFITHRQKPQGAQELMRTLMFGRTKPGAK